MPGPPPSCLCGNCWTCKNRQHRRDFYHRHQKFVIRKNVEAKKQRIARQRAGMAVSDEELDRRAVERWDEEWGPPNFHAGPTISTEVDDTTVREKE